MSPMYGLLVSWGVLTGVLILLLIYRSTLTMHEDDSIFLNDTESQMHKDQMEVLVKMNRITPIVKILGALSGVMILIIAGLFVYHFSQFHGITIHGLGPFPSGAPVELFIAALCLHSLWKNQPATSAVVSHSSQSTA